jgi:hypothetical protein
MFKQTLVEYEALLELPGSVHKLKNHRETSQSEKDAKKIFQLN